MSLRDKRLNTESFVDCETRHEEIHGTLFRWKKRLKGMEYIAGHLGTFFSFFFFIFISWVIPFFILSRTDLLDNAFSRINFRI